MEVIRIIKVHMPLEGVDTATILEEFRNIAQKYGREIKMKEIKEIIVERFGVE